MRVSAAALAAVLAMGGFAAQAAEREYMGPTITVVRQSKERIVGDFLNVKKLPKTISVDPLTPAEILDIQRQIYKGVMINQSDVNDSWMRAPGACMQWIFLRHQPHEPWQTVAARGGWPLEMLKVSGAFWLAAIEYRIPHVSKTSGRVIQTTQEEPGPGPGTGGLLGVMRGNFSSPTDALARYLDVERAQSKASRDRLPGFIFRLRLLNTEDLRVADKEVPCTHLAARCRRYVGKVERRSFYAYLPEAKELPERYGLVELDPRLNTEVAVEDMCPFAYMSLVQRPLNQRLSGGSGLADYSIKGNPGLPGALRPFAEGEKK